MSGDESAIKGLIKALLKIELKTEGGKINFGFGLILGIAFILALVGSLFHEVGSFILALFHQESKWSDWVPVVGIAVLAGYFVFCVLIVMWLERPRTSKP